MRSVGFVPHPRYGPPMVGADTETRPKPAPKIKIYVSSIFFESTRETAIKKYPLFLDSSWTPGDSARMKYGPKPVPETSFIRTLSQGAQLESKNGGYFCVGVSRVDSEDKILKRNFLFHFLFL